jgi:hypothetical protein
MTPAVHEHLKLGQMVWIALHNKPLIIKIRAKAPERVKRDAQPSSDQIQRVQPPEVA